MHLSAYHDKIANPCTLADYSVLHYSGNTWLSYSKSQGQPKTNIQPAIECLILSISIYNSHGSAIQKTTTRPCSELESLFPCILS